jgi:hypothetical protein
MLIDGSEQGTFRSPRWAGVATAAVALALVVALDPASTDYANQHFRAFLFDEVGVAPWNNMWLNGHHTPAYSVVAPPIMALFGVGSTAALCLFCVPLVFAATLGTLGQSGIEVRRPTAATVCVTALAAASMVIGQLAYLMGMVCGLAALLSLLHHRTVAAVLLALLAGASSPAAGLFLAIAVVAIAVEQRRRRSALAVAGAALVGFAVPMLWFPEGGEYYPISWGGAVNLLLLCAAVAAAGRRRRVIVTGVTAYAVLIVLTIVGVTGMGNIVARLAGLFAAPLVAVLWTGSRWFPTVVAVGALAFQWAPVAGVAFADVGGMRDRQSYQPLLDVLADYPSATRVEVVPLRTHDEADIVAREFPIARGWHRHLDRRDNALFYDDSPLTADEYQQWLNDRGVGIVAIADAKLDYGGVKERELLVAPPDYLELVYEDDVWRVFEVAPSSSAPVGVVTVIEVDSFTVRFDAAGALEVPVHFSPWFDVRGAACIRSDDEGWSVIEATAPGDVVVTARLSLRALVDRNGTC